MSSNLQTSMALNLICGLALDWLTFRRTKIQFNFGSKVQGFSCIFPSIKISFFFKRWYQRNLTVMAMTAEMIDIKSECSEYCYNITIQ